MSLINTLKEDKKLFMKLGNSQMVTILTTLIGEASMFGFNDGKRESTDAEVIGVIKKFITNAQSNADLLFEDENREARQKYLEEVVVYKNYLPRQFDSSTLKSLVREAFWDDLKTPDKKLKGVIMKYMKEYYAGQYDGKLAGEVIDELIKG